jgi:hypothetical protein
MSSYGGRFLEWEERMLLVLNEGTVAQKNLKYIPTTLILANRV